MEPLDLNKLMGQLQTPQPQSRPKPKFFQGDWYGFFNWNIRLGQKLPPEEGMMSFFAFALDYGPDIVRGRGRRLTLVVWGRFYELTWQWPKLHRHHIPRPGKEVQ